MKRRAFTLIELTLVLLILSILAASATLRAQRPLSRARMIDVIGQIEHFDHVTRTAAREQGRAMYTIVDLTAGELRRSDEEGESLEIAPLQLPRGFSIESVLVRDNAIYNGRTAISCNRQGAMPTYAILLAGPGMKQWLAFAGITSQMIKLEDEQQAQEIIDATGERGHAG